MLKVGDIFWTFRENTYSVGEISKLYVVGLCEDLYYFISTDAIIGVNEKMYIPVTEDANTLVKIQYYSESVYYTVSESVAVKFIESHYNN